MKLQEEKKERTSFVFSCLTHDDVWWCMHAQDVSGVFSTNRRIFISIRDRQDDEHIRRTWLWWKEWFGNLFAKKKFFFLRLNQTKFPGIWYLRWRKNSIANNKRWRIECLNIRFRMNGSANNLFKPLTTRKYAEQRLLPRTLYSDLIRSTKIFICFSDRREKLSLDYSKNRYVDMIDIYSMITHL